MEKDEFTTLLTQAADCLAANKGSEFWEEKLRSLAKKQTLDLFYLKQQIQSMYGGMGSINDLYIRSSNGDVNIPATEKFHTITSQIYALATRAET